MRRVLERMRGAARALWPARAAAAGARPLTHVAEIAAALAAADRLLAEDRTAEAQPLIDAAAPGIERMQGPDGARLRVHHRLLLGEFAHQHGRGDMARAWVGKAREPLAAVADAAERERLAARADVAMVLVSTLEDAGAEVLAAAERALGSAAARREPWTLLRLVWGAHWMAQIHHRRGDWRRAGPLFERVLDLAADLPRPLAGEPAAPDDAALERLWSAGRVVASNAALELAGVAQPLGRDEEARRWFARAVEVLDGARLPGARLARAHALMARALQEHADALDGPALRVARLAAAADEAAAAAEPRGWALAHQAEIAQARVHAGAGAPERAREHLARALAHAERLGPAGAAMVAGSHLAAGLHHAQWGDAAAARAAFATGWALGRSHPDPEVRRHAALCGAHLHAALLEGGEGGQAAGVLAALEAMLPALPSATRPLAAALAATGRGMEALIAGREAEAVEALERAVRLARAVEGDEGLAVLRRTLIHRSAALERAERGAEAAENLTDALDVPDRGTPPGPRAAERAEILLRRARVRGPAGAADDLREAIAWGRDSGTAHGRRLAAVAALGFGDMHRDEPDTRRRYYEMAMNYGRLSGLPDGLEVARAAELRLREPAE